MNVIKVNVDKPYNVYVGAGLLDKVGEICTSQLGAVEKILVVTDSNVAPLYLQKVINNLKESGYNVFSMSIPAGERSKTLETFGLIESTAVRLGLTRKDAFVALGGGVVGDLTGFAAASYMRGIKYVQIPTTLLAGIDASVGGKTAVDIPEGKNLVGAFWQPSCVIFDTETLTTLPKAEFLNGLGEGVKYAILCGGRIKEILENDTLDRDIDEFCSLCVEYKAKIVTEDEKESGIRALLNLGHTIAHAEETITNYMIPHGAAVSDGIVVIANAAFNAKQIDKATLDSITALIKKYDLGTKLDFNKDELATLVTRDKKMQSKGINVITIHGFGDCRIENMSIENFKEYIR